MAVTTIFVKRANNFQSYTRDLLEDIYHQFRSGIRSSNVSLMSGHLSLSVAPYMLASSSPLLKSILLGNDSISSIIVHHSFAKVLHSLVNLLYTGQVSNISNQEVELLMLLTKDLGMKGTIIEAMHIVSCKSRSTEMKRGVDARAEAVAIHSPLDGYFTSRDVPCDEMDQAEERFAEDLSLSQSHTSTQSPQSRGYFHNPSMQSPDPLFSTLYQSPERIPSPQSTHHYPQYSAVTPPPQSPKHRFLSTASPVPESEVPSTKMPYMESGCDSTIFRNVARCSLCGVENKSVYKNIHKCAKLYKRKK